MGRRGPNSQLRRINISEEQRKELLEGMEYCSILRDLTKRDRHTREFVNTRFALRTGRLWLTERQHDTAEFCAKKRAEELANYDSIKPSRKSKAVSELSNEKLIDLYAGALSLKRLHKDGLKQHREHAENKADEYRAEILKRMKKAKDN